MCDTVIVGITNPWVGSHANEATDPKSEHLPANNRLFRTSSGSI